ncbi:CaiB/BaiF CoA transferase family protein [Tropicimonas isoalkanivorans]|uniref:Crotonobetainyl-CoA:carnitine CoA-transferase CaiB n=1 Tax=Tropicimonas isoalkanivorans TaxID=441112 RepID=A0A1I1I1S5_9RHOB|nr:CaiB/BaiF CoA-transferase family protein [Tropicimonas isoalkanivorans]SFC27170.1 Crotonobetainyl-CoA:carnitine CoA-transferase CaiB [Tropicimonas isoalkanivorans]
MTLPLDGIRVLDFSTLLPGPLATLFLSEAGAEVTKIERPPTGDPMRESKTEFAALNRGKGSLCLDLKAPDSMARLRPLIQSADILVEQFRPGTMDRLGLGYDAVRAIRPDVIYCSINGYGSDGPMAQRAGHDLTFAAETGLMALTGKGATTTMPWALTADVGGGTYPALVNILLALLRRARTGDGMRIEIAMADGLPVFAPYALAERQETGKWPAVDGHLATGGSPRYRLYTTADGRQLAVACAEPKFWANFCRLIDLPADLAASGDAPRVAAAVAGRIAAQDAASWENCFSGEDVCCAIVRTPVEAEPFLAARGVPLDGPGMLSLPLARDLRRADPGDVPELNES